MSKIITIANEKGGVAKTTSTAAMGSILSRLGYKVILIDLDPQADLTIGFDIDSQERNIFDCLFKHKKLVASSVNENLVLVGGDPRLTPIEFMDELKKDQELKYDNPRLILKSMVESVKEYSDFILMDCPPNREIITQNALACSDYVLIPTEAHTFSTNGINNIIEFIKSFKIKLNPSLELLGIFVTRFRSNTSIHCDMYDWFKTNYSDHLFESKIHENITLQEATQKGRELEEHDKERRAHQLVKSKSPFKGLQDYQQLVNELLTKIEYEEKREISTRS